jgi:hypothetical protein
MTVNATQVTNMTAGSLPIPFAIITGNVIVVGAAIAIVFGLWRRLSRGEAYVRGRREPYRRNVEPIRYWLVITFDTILAAIFVAVAIIGHLYGPR